jgi:hypothetical protein
MCQPRTTLKLASADDSFYEIVVCRYETRVLKSLMSSIQVQVCLKLTIGNYFYFILSGSCATLVQHISLIDVNACGDRFFAPSHSLQPEHVSGAGAG